MRVWAQSSHCSTWPPRAAEGRRAAALDGRHDLELAEAYMAGVGSAPCRSMAAENICDLQNWTRHKSRALRGRPARSAHQEEQDERARYLPDRLGGHLGVERRGVELGVSEQDLDHPDVDILFQKMRGEAVAQRMQRHW